jgi:type IV pilus assembly protein PilM
MPALSLKPNLDLRLGGRRARGLVGLDIQPGYVAAVQAHVNGGITVQHALGAPLPPDAIREGEVLDERTLSDALRELFQGSLLGKRVRIGLANQRTVLRTLELPPVSDRKELAAAVRFQAEDQVPMPLAGAVLDFHSLGTFETPDGPRQRVIVVAAQREMVERLLRAVRHAGLRPEGVDLSAFALIRSLYRPLGTGAEGEAPARMLYLNVGGLTNMAIAEGSVCRFTRVVGGGLEAMASEIAERRGIPLVEARALLASYDLSSPLLAPTLAVAAPAPPAIAPVQPVTVTDVPAAAAEALPADSPPVDSLPTDSLPTASEALAPEEPQDVDGESEEPAVAFHEGFGTPPAPEVIETWALAQDPQGSATPPEASPEETSLLDAEHGVEEPAAAAPARPVAAPTHSAAGVSDPEVRMVLENGIREIVGEVRNSLDFHRSQEGGGEVSSVVLSGPALEISGFAEMLEADLGIAVQRESVSGAAADAFAGVSAHRLAIATGLATEEAPR